MFLPPAPTECFAKKSIILRENSLTFSQTKNRRWNPSLLASVPQTGQQLGPWVAAHNSRRKGKLWCLRKKTFPHTPAWPECGGQDSIFHWPRLCRLRPRSLHGCCLWPPSSTRLPRGRMLSVSLNPAVGGPVSLTLQTESLYVRTCSNFFHRGLHELVKKMPIA